MKHNLVLVTLNSEQINKAKDVNGNRKQITHALMCGPFGQIFGTKKQCQKYYSAWIGVFSHLFDKGIEADSYEISDYKSTFNLVNKLIAIHDPLEMADNSIMQKPDKRKKKKSLFEWLFG